MKSTTSTSITSTAAEPDASPRWVSRVVWLLLLVLLAIDIASMQRLSITYDEPNHYRYGEQILRGDASRFLDSVMPVVAINVLPARLGASLPDGVIARWLQRVETGRYVTVIASLLVAVCVFAWSRALYGAAGGLLALFLYTFDPNFLAHSQLITTDIYAAGGIALALYTFWRFLRFGGLRRAVGSAAAVGVALLVKYTSLALYPLLAVIAVGFYWPVLRHTVTLRQWRTLRGHAAAFIAYGVLFLLIGAVIVNAGFLFDRTFTQLRDYKFRSEQFQSLQASLARVSWLPVPAPYPYLEGFDWIVQRERTGDGYGNVYMLGEVRHGRGFPGYYLVASAFKLPLGTLILIAVAFVTYLRRQRRAGFLRDEWVIVVPAVFFIVYFNLFDRAQIGLRHFLVVFPLLYVLAGSLLRSPLSISRRAATALAIAALAIVASVASYYPHYLAYFNELVPDRKLAYRVLADSNLDWGQHRWYFEQYMKTHPGVIVEPDRPTVGTIAVGVNALTGVAYGPERFRWLRDNLEPIDHVAHAVLIYRVTPADLERIAGRR